MGWVHQSYDAVRDIALIVIINFGDAGKLYNLTGLSLMMIAAIILMILMKKEEKHIK